MSAGSDFSDWYKTIPQISRYWFTGSVILPLVCRFGILNPHNLVLYFTPFIYKFQVITDQLEIATSFSIINSNLLLMIIIKIWRPITALFYYPITPQTGFSYLINLYFLYSYSTRLETSNFKL